MTVLKISAGNREAVLTAVSRTIRDGGIAAFPTETFYGLGVRYDDPVALERLYKLKGRPKERAIPLILRDEEMLGLVGLPLSGALRRLAGKFWPGPLTILIDAVSDLPQLLTAGTGKVAVRVPGRSLALELAKLLDFPITATSANISGLPPAENAGKVIEYFGNSIDIIVDGGTTPGRMPSTIVEIKNGRIRIVRPGQISEEQIQNAM